MRAAYTRFKRHQFSNYLISYKQARARFRRQLKKARHDSWVTFLSSITWKTPLSQIWKKIQKIAGKFKPHPLPVLQIDGEPISDPKRVSDAFAEHFARVSHQNSNAPFLCSRDSS